MLRDGWNSSRNFLAQFYLSYFNITFTSRRREPDGFFVKFNGIIPFGNLCKLVD